MSDREKRSALRLAINLMEKRISDIAFHANLEDRYAASLPVTCTASKEREQLKKAIEVLTEVVGKKVQKPTIIRDETISEALDILDNAP